MYLTTNSQHKNFHAGQTKTPPRVWTTNAFRMQLPFKKVVPEYSDLKKIEADDLEDPSDKIYCIETGLVYDFPDLNVVDSDPDNISWDLTDPIRPKLTIKMTKDGDNKSFARAFPCQSISMFGRYETIGAVAAIDGERIPKFPGERGQGSMSCPVFDLKWAEKIAGYPCKLVEMPPTTVYADAFIPSRMNANTLLDFYLHWHPDGSDVNSHISPNDSKLLNIQFQMDCGAMNNPNKHAWGWSGGTYLMTVTIFGVTYQIAYKRETAGNNDFPFLSFWAGVKITEVEMVGVITWLINNWEKIEAACAEKGCDLLGCTLDKILESYTCGPHVGNEVLGYCDDTIEYRRLEIDVDRVSHKYMAPPKDIAPVEVTDTGKKSKSGKGKLLAFLVLGLLLLCAGVFLK